MRLLERLYRSPFGLVMSAFGHAVAQSHRPFMLYGFRDPGSGQFRKFVRMSSSVVINSKENMTLGEDVWVWHHSVLDATEGIVIEEGCQIGAWVGIFTHGSENSIRLLGRRFIDIENAKRAGYSRGPVRIGAYTFIGSGSIVLPGVSVGKGCLIGVGTLVAQNVPDYSVFTGWPGQVKGSTTDWDRMAFRKQDYSDTYYDQDALSVIRKRMAPRATAGKE